uniref:PhoLip_ATPase_C domain-containing protein n=1 Tax=Meloidogyne hapla TaxID=6305 RepID=A0A1I8BWB9_MELHA
AVVGVSSFYLPPRTPIRDLSPTPTELPQHPRESQDRQTKSASSHLQSPIITSPTTVGSRRPTDTSTSFPAHLRLEEGLMNNGTNNVNHMNIPLSARSDPSKNKSPQSGQPTTSEDLKEGSGGYALVINGEALVHALKAEHEKTFLEIARNCSSVICCRVTPLQKAKVVELVKRNIKAVTLAIGDGANDVSMIRTAHIGVGISGHEGMQAVLSSDFSIGQFRFLERLLLVHGRQSYLRMCKFLRYFFYKNFAYTLTNFWYSFFSGYSAQTVYDPVLISLYNLLFTALPVLAMGILDQDVNDEYSLRFPRLYIPGQFNLFFNMRIFIYSVIHGMISSLVLFFVPYGTLYNAVSATGRDMNDYSILAFTSFTALVLVVNGQIAFDTSYWTWINWFVVLGSVGVYFGVVVTIYQALICAILLLPTIGNRFFWFDAHPSYAERLRVRRRLYGEEKAKPTTPATPQHALLARGRTSRWSSKQRDLRSGYAFSHCAGFGELIAKGTLFKNLENLRIPSFQHRQIHPSDTSSNTSGNNESNKSTRRCTIFNGGNGNGGGHLLDSLRNAYHDHQHKKHQESENGINVNDSSINVSEIADETPNNANNNSIAVTKFSPSLPSNISTTTTLLAEKDGLSSFGTNNSTYDTVNSQITSSSFSNPSEKIIGPMITQIPVHSSNNEQNETNGQIDHQMLQANSSSVLVPMRVPSPDRVNTTHSLVVNADMDDEKPLPSNWFGCHNPDGTLYIPDRPITEQIPSKQQPNEIPVQIACGNNNNKFVSKKGKKTTSFVDNDGNSKSSSEGNPRKSIPVEIEKQRQQQRLFTGKHRNNQNNNNQQKENEKTSTWNNERWKL